MPDICVFMDLEVIRGSEEGFTVRISDGSHGRKTELEDNKQRGTDREPMKLLPNMTGDR